jgi:hypothetical protein
MQEVIVCFGARSYCQCISRALYMATTVAFTLLSSKERREIRIMNSTALTVECC